MSHIKLFACDVDGILTDGSLLFSEDGQEFKKFHARDGIALKWLQRSGIPIAWITGRSSPTVARRATELGIEHLYLGSDNKYEALIDLQEKTGLKADQIAYMGDDLVDLPILIRVGWSITVPDAPVEVRERVDLVTQNPGGSCAVREVIEILLKQQGRWEAIVAGYLA